jgi:NADH-quinone oxidoreductase subunit J
MTIAFWVLAFVTVAAALMVVLVRSIFRTALALILCFLAVAGIFVTLSADFLAAVQVLIYVGAVAILLILAIMLTRESERGNQPNNLRLPALLITALFTGLSLWALASTVWPLSTEQPGATTVAGLGTLLIAPDGLMPAVEIAALLILATIIGAVSLTRRK